MITLERVSEILGGLKIMDIVTIKAKSVKTTPSGTKYWSIKVATPSGEEFWASTFSAGVGKTIDGLTEGQQVQMEYVRKGQYYNITQLAVVRTPSPKYHQELEKDYQKRQAAIIAQHIAQSSIGHAVNLLPHVLHVASPTGQNVKIEDVMALVTRIADRIMDYVYGKVMEVELGADMQPDQAEPASAEAAEPKA